MENSSTIETKIKRYRHKICCHCGRETHRQPQDFNHDKNYGHCLACLTKEDWYVYKVLLSGQHYRLNIFIGRPATGAPLTSDDSDPKVIELYLGGNILVHQTIHSPIPQILESINLKFKTKFRQEG